MGGAVQGKCVMQAPRSELFTLHNSKLGSGKVGAVHRVTGQHPGRAGWGVGGEQCNE